VIEAMTSLPIHKTADSSKYYVRLTVLTGSRDIWNAQIDTAYFASAVKAERYINERVSRDGYEIQDGHLVRDRRTSPVIASHRNDDTGLN
jgi:hypothetical protein